MHLRSAVDRDQAVRARDLGEERGAAAKKDPELEDSLRSKAIQQLDVILDPPSRFGDEEIPRVHGTLGRGPVIHTLAVQHRAKGCVADLEPFVILPSQHRAHRSLGMAGVPLNARTFTGSSGPDGGSGSRPAIPAQSLSSTASALRD
jgi:hypothetical protein